MSLFISYLSVCLYVNVDPVMVDVHEIASLVLGLGPLFHTLCLMEH